MQLKFVKNKNKSVKSLFYNMDTMEWSKKPSHATVPWSKGRITNGEILGLLLDGVDDGSARAGQAVPRRPHGPGQVHQEIQVHYTTQAVFIKVAAI